MNARKVPLELFGLIIICCRTVTGFLKVSNLVLVEQGLNAHSIMKPFFEVSTVCYQNNNTDPYLTENCEKMGTIINSFYLKLCHNQ